MARWYRRIAALAVGGVVGALAPAVAWAYTSDTTMTVADGLAKAKVGKAAGVVGFLGALCCLVVVAAIVLAVVAIMRRRK